jgi:hypothetical protein
MIRHHYIKFCLLFLLIAGSTVNAVAQKSAVEYWPETDIWYRVNSSWRLASFIAVTKYFENNTRDLNATFLADYAFGRTKNPLFVRLQDELQAQSIKAWLVRCGYMKGMSLYDLGESYTENMGIAEVHKRIPLKGHMLLSSRLRTDLRWVGQEADFSYRLRFRMMVEKEFTFNNKSFVPYISVEPFWDSRFELVNRVRAIGGTTFAWGERIALEGNFTYQYDSKASITNIYAFNVILHVFIVRHHLRPTSINSSLHDMSLAF